MPFDADDLAILSDADMPGYTLATIGADTVPGRFRAAHKEVFGVSTTGPTFAADASLLAGATVGATVTIDGTSYTVADRQPQTCGELRLVLELA